MLAGTGRSYEGAILSMRKHGDVVVATRKAIAPRIAQGHPDMQEVAAALGMNVRTLQRRLAEAGTCYKRIIDEVRLDAACRLLGDRNLTLAEIAAALGYSHPAHFTRAFTRWTGMTPRAFRGCGPQRP